jgi:hypothetical protein
MRLKKDQNPTRQTLSHVAHVWYLKHTMMVWCELQQVGKALPLWPCICSPHGLSFLLTPLIAWSFPWKTFHIPASSNMPASPLQLSLHLHKFPHCLLMGCLQRYWPCHTMPGLQGFLSWNLGGSLHDTIPLAFHMPTVPRIEPWLKLPEYWWVKLQGNNLVAAIGEQGSPLLKGMSFKWVYCFIPLSLKWLESGQFLRCHPIVQIKNIQLLFNGINLFRSHCLP